MRGSDKTVSLLGYNIFSTDLEKLESAGKVVVNTINPHSYCVAKQDEVFKDALEASDVLLPDGIGIVLATRILLGKRIQKIAGADLHKYLLRRAEEQKLRVFYLGASENTLARIVARIGEEHPDIAVGVYSPPYKPVFSEEDDTAMIAAINAFAPDYLFIGMTAPKQEKWAYTHKERLNAGIISSIGAVFDFYAGTVKRPNPFWIRLGLEWFVRFVKEPRRLASRNLRSMPLFLLDVFSHKIGVKRAKNNSTVI